MKKYKLYEGDNMDSLKKLPDNSIDSIVTDPPYGLSFMNKKWDYDVPSVDFWREVYRVLKPGGHVLSFGGTRTYHRMVVNIEDAGFEIRDQIMWIYGSGFPKSHNVSKKIEQDIDNLIYSNIWKNKLDNVKIVEPTLKKNQIEVGNNIEIQGSAHESVVEKVKEKQSYQNVIVVEKIFTEAHHILKENPIVQENAEQFIIQQQDLVKCVEQLKEDQIVKLLSTFIVEESVKDMLNDYSMNKIKVEEVQKTLNGREKFSVLEIIPVLCVVLPKILKHIILNQSRTFQNLDTKSQMDCVSATSVTITKYIMEHLIGNTVSILKRRIDFTIDNGHSALKPANEPICLARKPLSEKSVAENVLKWRTGGINVDGTRITSYSSSDKTSDNTYSTIPSHILSELQDTLYKAEPFSLVVENHQDLFPSDVSCVQNWLKLQDYLGDYLIYHHLYDGLLPLFQEDDQVSVQQLHDALSYISRYEEQSDNPLGLNNHLYISSLSKIILMFIDRVIEKVDKKENINEGRFPANVILECICDEVIKGEKGEVKKSGGSRENCDLSHEWGYSDIVRTNFTDKGDIHTNPMCPCRLMDEQSGVSKSSKFINKGRKNGVHDYGFKGETLFEFGHNDKGGASRFFYQAKVSKKERNMGLDGFEDKVIEGRDPGQDERNVAYKKRPTPTKNTHPTLKPVNLMAYLCRLITPPNGIVLDPFMGSGSTGIAAQLEGFRFVGMEMEPEYFKIAEARIENWEKYKELKK